MYQRILVAVDGSDGSAAALNQAENLARTFGSRLLLLHAYHDPSDIVGSSDYSIALAKRMKKGQEVLDRMGTGIVDLEVEEHLVEGPDAEAIVKAAKAHAADLIVIGSRGLGLVAGALLGSVSRRVCRQAPCSVLVVR